ncbi:hypothetical protein Cni_G03092 [Canna indica]|uniref:Uncharacterized protein n=1 Tax=Canna indica TaxID=4628 RepID=A0AAQ3Q2R7_9LILI|nr:hypothetical protein Cni_G03092 [Canna indica]
MESLRILMKSFELASGLKIIFSKTKFIHIGNNQETTNLMVQTLGCSVYLLPIEYLGLPVLHLGQLHKDDQNKEIAKFDRTLTSWKGSIISRARRRTLINSVLTRQASYFLSIFEACAWVIKQMDKQRRTFYWVSNGTILPRGRCHMNHMTTFFKGARTPDMVGELSC